MKLNSILDLILYRGACLIDRQKLTKSEVKEFLEISKKINSIIDIKDLDLAIRKVISDSGITNSILYNRKVKKAIKELSRKYGEYASIRTLTKEMRFKYIELLEFYISSLIFMELNEPIEL